ncbi:MAG: hypothetical protein AUK55_08840 [Syntrophobacteraceae bacterium CG2_30_61_12]|nr:MAG: hypothetical protein AUK55_08840 [Syntrophobacteraceae bacterium CG2_30_61_12]PIU31789.1 MAG: hypothetical protein COT06_06305 [Syntrophobacteraceae bacterium CG07_land_8_20_14_0_80_61_8]
MEPVRGLICRIALPADPQAMDWASLLNRLAPHVDGLLLDHDYWQDRHPGGDVAPALIAAIDRMLPHLPPEPALLLHISGRNRDQTGANLDQLQAFLNARAIRQRLIWVDLPLLYHSNRGLPGLYRELRHLTEQPLLLENDPDRVRRVKPLGRRSNIRTQIVKSLAREQSVVGLIHHGDLSRALNYSRAAAGNRRFTLLDGSEPHFLDYPSTSGLVSISANLLPDLWARLVPGARAGAGRADPTAQYQALRRLRQLSQALAADPAAGVLHLLFLDGVLRQPPSLPPAQAGALEQLWRELGQPKPTCTAS